MSKSRVDVRSTVNFDVIHLQGEQAHVTMKCPTRAELLTASLGPDDATREAIPRHIEGCAQCRELVQEIRAIAAVLHFTPAVPPSSSCLDADAIAALVDGTSLDLGRAAIEHIAACASCRTRMAAVARLTADATIASEIRALEPAKQLTLHRWSPRNITVAGGLAAAAVAAIVLLGPTRARLGPDEGSVVAEATREPATTTTAAPRVVSPTEFAERSDSLRWTSVPQADLYRVRIWNTEGTVLWTTETRETAAPLPGIVQPGRSYLLDVKARTGWDRWASSDFVAFTLRDRNPR